MVFSFSRTYVWKSYMAVSVGYLEGEKFFIIRRISFVFTAGVVLGDPKVMQLKNLCFDVSKLSLFAVCLFSGFIRAFS